jgi:hypothetical protein
MNRNLAFMVRLGLLALAWNPTSVSAQPPPPAAKPDQTVSGIVFDDANRDGRRQPDEKGLPDVRVSNGREIVKTDSQGRYKLPVSGDAIIFVIKPSGWMTALDENNLPRFYYIHEPQGAPALRYPGVSPTGPLPESVDFPLHRSEEPTRFKALFFGDTQVTKPVEITYLAHDIIEELIGTDAAFGVTLGDLVGDAPSLFEDLAATVGLIGVPWYNVPGNHDENYDSPDDTHALEAFHRVFGPAYYSYDYGPVHFLALDDVIWLGKTADSKKGDYKAGLGPRQLDFVRNDLALLPKDQLVVLMMHIPLTELAELKELFTVLDQHPHTLSIAGHYHFQQHLFFGKKQGWNGPEPHHLFVNATACGAWWMGATDEMGLPHATMQDGAPNGYSIVTFDGPRYVIEFRPARRPADFQMSIWAPEEVAQDRPEPTEVLVNVFAGSERSKVEMRLGQNGRWQTMRMTPGVDPYYAAMREAVEQEQKEKPKDVGTSRAPWLPKPVDCPHLWRGTLPAKPPKGLHVIYVRTTDMFGQTYAGQRVIRIR